MTHAELVAAGMPVDAEAHARLARYVAALLDENTRINLTGTREPEAFWRDHVCDCLALLPLLDETGATRVVDLGAGGGLPGMVIACARPGLHVTLLDSTRKKIDALGRIVEAVGIGNASPTWGRAEALGHDPTSREHYDAVTARAVGPLVELVELGSGLLAVGGYLWAFKSLAQAELEVSQAITTAKACKLKFRGAYDYTLPEPAGRRAILGYQKEKPLPPTLPRTGEKIKRKRL